VVVGGNDGGLLLWAWRFLCHCGSAAEAEAEAYLEGIRLVTQWIKQPTYAETDCSFLIKHQGSDGAYRSICAVIISEITRLASDAFAQLN
jgi:hypothetical protein